jgi:hypothetical protein
MHQNFYHWHKRVDLKPDPAILQARWDAATKFIEEMPGVDICSLLRLALFGTVATEFAKRFSDALVTIEPTFPPERNTELLRVMATAALYSQMEDESMEADAVALGLLAAAFLPDRIQPICTELMQRAREYLAAESERMRPTLKVGSKYLALEKAVDAAEWATNPSATKLLGNAVLELGETMGRISEENQFLWWLLSRYSSLLNTRREKISQNEYALVAAAEAAARVTRLPPPASVKSLIGEVLTQCSKTSFSSIPLSNFIASTNIDCLSAVSAGVGAHELCPLTGLIAVQHARGKADIALLKTLNISAKLKILPIEVADQYFNELMFLKALALLN